MDRNKIVNSLGTTEEKILYLVKIDPTITQEMMAKELNLARSTISSNIKKLKIKGVIDRIGSDRIGYWKILK